MEVRLVPWESWNLWNEVRQAIFSSSPMRVSTALDKIAAWRTRSSLPVAVEVTGDLISIQRIDPCFSTSSVTEISVTNEMLCLMYAMAIMRLINGIVDQSKKQNTSSVATRAEAAGLPRMLVDIRHEVAHQQLPSLSYLQLASKQALEWLKVHYWEAQKQVLDDMQKCLQAKLHVYASQSETPNKVFMRVRGCQKLLARRAKKLVTLSSPVVNLFGDCNDTVHLNTTNSTGTDAMPDNLEELICNSELIDVEFQKSQGALSRAEKRLQSFYKSNCNILLTRSSGCDVPNNMRDTIVTRSNSMVTSEKISKSHAKEKSPLKEKWTISNDWKPCAIGMLPSKIHSAGVLPFFGCMLPGLAREAACPSTVQEESVCELTAGILRKEASAFEEMEDTNAPTGEKRNFVGIETKQGTLKRFKADTEACQTYEKYEDVCNIEVGHSDALREAVQNGSLLHEKHQAPLSGGFLLLHGLYQRCGADQLAAIRSSIQVLK